MYLFVSALSMAIAFFAVAVSIKKRTSPAQKWMMLTSICAFVYFGGNYYKHCAESLQMLMVSQKAILLSVAFISLGVIRSIGYACEIDFKEWQKWTLNGLAGIYALISLNIDNNHFWYKTYEAVPSDTVAGCVRLSVTNGWLYYVGNALLLIPFIAGIVYLIVSILNRPSNKFVAVRSVSIILGVPVLALIISLTGVLTWGATFYAVVLGLVIGLIVIQLRFDVLSTESIAKERLVESSNEGLIILDDEGRFYYANKRAKSIVPAITRNKVDAVNKFINEELLSRDIYEINDKCYSIRVENLLDEGGTTRGKTIIITDITEMRQATLKLSILSKKLEEGNALIVDKGMNDAMKSIAATFATMYIIDLNNKTVTECSVYSKVQAVANASAGVEMQQLMWNIINARISSDYCDMMKEFTTFDTLEERLAGKREISVEVLNLENVWIKFSFIRIGDIKSSLDKVIFASQNIDYLKKIEE